MDKLREHLATLTPDEDGFVHASVRDLISATGWNPGTISQKMRSLVARELVVKEQEMDGQPSRYKLINIDADSDTNKKQGT